LVGVPEDITYNGSLADESGLLLDGTYYMKLVIADSAATDPGYWNNEEGNAPTVLIPATPIEVDVVQGIFSVVLEGVDSSVLANPDANLWVFVSDAVDGTFEALGADPLNSVPYAISAGHAETAAMADSVDGSAISGEIDGMLLADGTVDADKLGTILIDVPFIDADGDGQPDAAGTQNVSMKTIIESISKNSKLGFNDVNPNRTSFEVFLEKGQQVGRLEGFLGGGGGSATPGTFVDPFPISQVYEYNGGLMPILSIIDVDGNDITGQAGNPVPGLTFSYVTNQDVEGTSAGAMINDGLNEGRMIVTGIPSTLGDFTVRVRATNRWGMDFVQEYTIRVRDVDIDTTVFAQRQSIGSSSWTTSGATTPYGGDPVRFQFIVEDDNNNVIPLADDVLVRWTYPNPNGGGSLTSDILGPLGQIFYLNSTSTPVGLAPSNGAILIDEDPLGPDIDFRGTYSALILFDWGQGVNVGSTTITDILDGYTYDDFLAIQYDAPNGLGTTDLFDQFTDSGSYTVGDESVSGQYFGATPAGDEPAWNLISTIEAGETDKNLIGQNPFGVLDGGGAYIRGTMQNRWIQQKYAWIWNGSTWVKVQVSVRDLDRTTLTDGVSDPLIVLDLDGFGPDPVGTWPLSTAGGAGMISDDDNKRDDFDYPEDGGDFTFTLGTGFPRPGGAFAGVASARSQDALDYLQPSNRESILATYWLYSTNGFIDTLAPITAIVEVGNNINIVNDLVPPTQVAGYPTQVGGDFGTTNGEFEDLLKPDPVNTATQIVAWGINDLAYIWNASGNNGGFSLTNSNANRITVPGTSMVNNVTSNDGVVDFTYTLGLDSGFSHETTPVGVNVVSDVVIWDFFLQEIDLSLNEGDVGYYPQNVPTTDPSTINESITIDQGDDLLLTVVAYVRPSLLTGLDDGGITDNLLRDLSARFWIVPTVTNTKVEITNDITMTVEDIIGADVDINDNHVLGPLENRVVVTWEVILENPLQALAQTNVATGYVYAEITSSLNGSVVNTVSTLAGAGNQIAPTAFGFGVGDDTENIGVTSAAESDVVGPDFTLDARVKMPLSSVEAVITVNP
jgi:hypothetical protein